MVFRSVTGHKNYFKYSECYPGQILVEAGTFIGSEDGRYGIQHEYRLASGEIVVLNSAGHLNWQLEHYGKTGGVYNVVYLGTDVLESGAFKGKTAHKFDLQFDDGVEASEPEAERQLTESPKSIKAAAIKAKPMEEKAKVTPPKEIATKRKAKSVVKAGEDFEL